MKDGEKLATIAFIIKKYRTEVMGGISSPTSTISDIESILSEPVQEGQGDDEIENICIHTILESFGCPTILPYDENVTMYYHHICSAMTEYAQLKTAHSESVRNSAVAECDRLVKELEEAKRLIGDLTNQIEMHSLNVSDKADELIRFTSELAAANKKIGELEEEAKESYKKGAYNRSRAQERFDHERE